MKAGLRNQLSLRRKRQGEKDWKTFAPSLSLSILSACRSHSPSLEQMGLQLLDPVYNFQVDVTVLTATRRFFRLATLSGLLHAHGAALQHPQSRDLLTFTF